MPLWAAGQVRAPSKSGRNLDRNASGVLALGAAVGTFDSETVALQFDGLVDYGVMGVTGITGAGYTVITKLASTTVAGGSRRVHGLFEGGADFTASVQLGLSNGQQGRNTGGTWWTSGAASPSSAPWVLGTYNDEASSPGLYARTIACQGASTSRVSGSMSALQVPPRTPVYLSVGASYYSAGAPADFSQQLWVSTVIVLGEALEAEIAAYSAASCKDAGTIWSAARMPYYLKASNMYHNGSAWVIQNTGSGSQFLTLVGLTNADLVAV